MSEWRINPYAEKRRVPDEIEHGELVDVIMENGQLFVGVDPILYFMGPEIVAKYRYPSELRHLGNNIHAIFDGMDIWLATGGKNNKVISFDSEVLMSLISYAQEMGIIEIKVAEGSLHRKKNNDGS